MKIEFPWLAACFFAAVMLTTPAVAQERSAVKHGFSLTEGSKKKILVFRPSVTVGAQSTGGMFEPNAEWTEAAKANLQAALNKLQNQFGNEVLIAPDTYGEDARSR